MKTLKIFCGCYNPSKILLRNLSVTSNRCRIFRYPKLVGNRALKDPDHELTLEEKILNALKGKLIYNSLVNQKNLYVRWKIRAEELAKMNQKKESSYLPPVSLRYMYDESDVQKCVEEDELSDDEIVEEECSDDDEYSDDEFHLPYSRAEKVDVEDTIRESTMIQKQELLAYQDICPKPIQGRRWMSDYECFDEEISDETPYDSTEVDYGTPDPRVPPSNVPCGGCGAHLHCQNPSIPGYLPQELYKKCKKKDLMSLICQRCTFLKNYNTALTVNVDVESYPRMLAKLRDTNALVILMVDMTDFPCSIWPKLLDTIGGNKPIIVVGNKIDLLPGDSPGWLEKAKQSLIAELPKKAKIIHVGFVSAKTGFGVEELINKLFSLWGNSGDVYLVGCTNVGKSSLFNALLRSDYCKSTAVDLIQRAVTSPWPGTTLNLLKFPITKINAWKSFLRTSRLVSKKINENRERKLAKVQAKLENAKLSVLPSIIGTINTTFKKPPESTDLSVMPESEFFVMRTPKKYELKKDTRPVFNPKDKLYQTSNWCFDTPGVVHEDQIINLLTTEEIMKLLPQTTIVPRVYSVRPEQTLFIGGVARLDLLHCDNKFVRIVIYASQFLPITLCETKHAEDVHEVLIGTSYMAVPRGSLKRLEQWPGLKYDKDFELKGQGFSLVTSEIVLSSTGWIGVSAPHGRNLVIRPWTPLARGIYLRKFPVLKLTTKLRKKRIANTPTYFMAQI